MDQRSHFHTALEGLEQSIHEMGERAHGLVGQSVVAVTESDMGQANLVVEDGRVLDAQYFEIHTRWLNLMARQQPMATDLRLMSVLLHLNVTLQRTGDQCVNIAKIALETGHLPRSARIIDLIREMGDLVRPMLRTAIESFARREPDEARLLPAMDEPVDRINEVMPSEVVACGADPGLLEWAAQMMMTARALERIGDQAVDIAEQVVFLVTGDFNDFDEEALIARGIDG